MYTAVLNEQAFVVPNIVVQLRVPASMNKKCCTFVKLLILVYLLSVWLRKGKKTEECCHAAPVIGVGGIKKIFYIYSQLCIM